MKNRFFLLAITLFASVMFVNAQGGGNFQRRTVEERVKIAHDKIDSTFKLDAEKLAKVDAAFTTFYKGQDKVREELTSGGERPDMQVMREKMQPLTDARDKELKAVLTEDQYKKWKDELEPTMSPRRRPQQ
jgi:hypothetical protein